MKNRFLLPSVLVIALFATGFYLSQKSRSDISNTTPKTTEGAVADEQTVNVNVTANNGKFEPNSFKSDIFGTLNLNVNAVDKDYQFKVEDYSRLDANLAKGKTTTIKIQFLGLGDYIFTCGEGCSGTITIESIQDIEDLKKSN